LANTKSRDFKPGHPFFFWLSMILFAFAFFSGAKAVSTVRDCDAVSGGTKHWQALPPEWVCSSGHFQITANQN